jgi:hypothetical protein
MAGFQNHADQAPVYLICNCKQTFSGGTVCTVLYSLNKLLPGLRQINFCLTTVYRYQSNSMTVVYSESYWTGSVIQNRLKIEKILFLMIYSPRYRRDYFNQLFQNCRLGS